MVIILFNSHDYVVVIGFYSFYKHNALITSSCNNTFVYPIRIG